MDKFFCFQYKMTLVSSLALGREASTTACSAGPLAKAPGLLFPSDLTIISSQRVPIAFAFSDLDLGLLLLVRFSRGHTLLD
jgi:hypothetical protein